MLGAILIVFCFGASIIIVVHVFKIRYLDYYVKAKEEKQENINSDNKEKIELKPTEK